MDHDTFISSLARQLSIEPRQAESLTNALTAAIMTSAADLNSVAIPGFGRFDAVKTDEYIDIDPSDGIRKLFPPSVKMSFTPGSMLKKRLSHE